MTVVISVVSQKGGVGKTTTAVNLASALAVMERDVLLVDLDPQGNATSGLGIDKKRLPRSLYDVMINRAAPADVVQTADIHFLKALPATMDLFRIEVELMRMPHKEQVLNRFLDPLKETYEYVIVDSPPSFGILTFNAIAAADILLIPVQCGCYALEAVDQMMHVVHVVKKRLNPDVAAARLLITMVEPDEAFCSGMMETIREKFGDMVFETVINRDTRLKQAQEYGGPVLLRDLDACLARDYFQLAREVLRTAKGRDPLLSEESHRGKEN